MVTTSCVLCACVCVRSITNPAAQKKKQMILTMYILLVGRSDIHCLFLVAGEGGVGGGRAGVGR